MAKYIFLTITILIWSCNSNTNEKEVLISLSKIKLTEHLQSRLKGLTFDDSIEQYYSNPTLSNRENKRDSSIFMITKAYSENIFKLIKENLQYTAVWNEDILKVKSYDTAIKDTVLMDWAYDPDNCAENVLISEGKEIKSDYYYCICFDSLGLIKSLIPLLDTEAEYFKIGWL